MSQLFLFIALSGLIYLFFLALKQAYFQKMIIFIVVIVLFGSGYLWIVETKKKVADKFEGVSNRVYSVQQSIDRFNDRVDNVDNTVDKVKKPLDKGVKALDNLDKRIEDGYDNLVDRIFNRDKKKE